MNRKLKLAFLTLFSICVMSGGIIAVAGGYDSAVKAQDFDVCITDDDGAATLRFNSRSGDYVFCAGGKTFAGQGEVTKVGRVLALQHQTSDRRLVASVNTAAKSGSGSLQSPVGQTVGTISDRNTADSVCRCR